MEIPKTVIVFLQGRKSFIGFGKKKEHVMLSYVTFRITSYFSFTGLSASFAGIVRLGRKWLWSSGEVRTCLGYVLCVQYQLIHNLSLQRQSCNFAF